MTHDLSLLSSFALALAVAPAFAQSVHVVDDDMPADFASITAAIAAASDGDTIVVRDGTYDAFTLDGVGLTIVADAGAQVVVTSVGAAPMTTLRNLPAGSKLRLRGIDFLATGNDFRGPGLSILSCDGEVWVEDCLTDTMPITTASSNPFRQSVSVDIRDAASVVLDRCSLRGMDGICVFFTSGTPEVGGVALSIENSGVLAHGCTIRSGSSCFLQGAGADGVVMTGGTLVLRDCSVRGGAGFIGGSISPPGPGGDGLRLRGGAVAWAINAELIGGMPPSLFFPAIPGAPFNVVGATLNQAAGDAVTLTTSPLLVVNPSAGGAAATLGLDTVAGASTLLIASVGTSPAFAPGLPGFFGTALDQVAIPAGTTDMAGRLDASIPILALPSGVAALDLAVQFAVLSPAGDLGLSNPSAITIVERN